MIQHQLDCAPLQLCTSDDPFFLNKEPYLKPIETLMVTNKHLICVRYIYTVKWGRNEILLNNFFYIHWCTVVTVHNRAGAESFLHKRFVHNRAGAESILHNRFVHNRAGAQSFLHNWYVHNRAGAESCRVQSIRCSIILVHNRSVPDRSCWIGTVQNRAVLDRYHPFYFKVQCDSTFSHESTIKLNS